MSADDHVRAVARAGAAFHARLPAAQHAAQQAIGGHAGGHSLLRRLLGRLFGWLVQLLPRLTVAGSAASLLGYAVLAAVVALAVAVAVRALRGRSGRPPAATGPAASQVAGFADARATALRLAPTDPLEALRQLYAALLRELGGRRGWRSLPGRSNWTFVRWLGPATGQGRALAECTRLFEARVYGSIPAEESDVRRIDELAEAVLG